MPDKIIHIRSLTPGSVPTTSSLGVGELAINVNDGKIFVRQSGSLGDTIQSAVTTNNLTSGSVRLSGSLQVTGSVNAPSITGSLFGTSSWASNSISSSYALSGSYAETASFAPAYLPLTGGTITGNLTVVGTASFAYTTASVVSVGTNVIILNTDNPSSRFGGITVVDSGSFGNSSTGSLFWDSQNNRWIYSNPSGSTYDGGMLISGPRNTSGLGNETGMDANFVAVGQGADHIRPGSIYNSGSITIVTGSLTVTQGITGSLEGTSSFAISSSFANTASIVQSIANNITNNVDNYVLTATGVSTVNGEVNLRFDGSKLKIQGELEQGDPDTSVEGAGAHAEGRRTVAKGDYSHTEGRDTNSIGNYSHAEGYLTEASGEYSHAEGYLTIATGNHSHAEGRETNSIGNYSHAEGYLTEASGSYSHAEGAETLAIGAYSHAEGSTTLTGIATAFSATEKDAVLNGLVKIDAGYGNVSGNFTPGGYLYLYDDEFGQVYGWASFEINAVDFNGTNTFVQLFDTSVTTTTAYVGDLTYLLNNQTFGGDQVIPGPYAHAEGLETQAIGPNSHTEGYLTAALGKYSHAEGESSQAIGDSSHAEGRDTQAIGLYSHAEGRDTQATGNYSHAEGNGAKAIGTYSHAEGLGTITSGSYQHVQGQFNIPSSAQSAFIIGNGINDSTKSNLVFAAGNTVQVTGSLNVSGSITGSLFGTASWANNAVSSSQAVSSSFAISASWAPSQAVDTSSLVTTSSFNAYTGSNTSQFAGTASFALTASNSDLLDGIHATSFILTNQTSSMSVATASFAATASFLTSGVNIETLDGLSIIGSGSLPYIDNLIFSQNIGYYIPNVGNTTYTGLRNTNSVNQSGAGSTNVAPSRMTYTSAATVGSLTWQRGTVGGSYVLSTTTKFYYKRRFQINCNISDSRFLCGLSNQFGTSNPTNVEPNTIINIIGVCKLAASSSLSFIYNDATGTATTVDLGVNYPADNTTTYTYDLEIYKEFSSSDITLKLTRIDSSGNKISTSQVINTNYNTSVTHSSVIWGCNNATATAYSFIDFGILFKNYDLGWETTI